MINRNDDGALAFSVARASEHRTGLNQGDITDRLEAPMRFQDLAVVVTRPAYPDVQRLSPRRKARSQPRCGPFGWGAGAREMFFFFSNRLGVLGSIVISLIVTLVLLRACAG
jgi:hypothetical protein